MSASIRQLEMERDQLRHQLAEVADKTQSEISILQQHMELQIHQQLQQKQRDLLEEVHEQLHEQQQQINALQQLVQKQKSQIENQDVAVDEINFENSAVPYEQLKPAFAKLQVRSWANFLIDFCRFKTIIGRNVLFSLFCVHRRGFCELWTRRQNF
jgi:seryl-tRNA synthetase